MSCTSASCYTSEIQSIEDIHQKFESIRNSKTIKDVITEKDMEDYTPFIMQLLEKELTTYEIERIKPKSRKNSFFLSIARNLVERGTIDKHQLSILEERLRITRAKSHSGVLVITVFTSPYPTYTNESGETVTQPFSCQWNCHYCPNEPGQPRSYLQGEPGVMRANKYQFDVKQQMWGRMKDLYDTGHAIDKLEVLILGGTWESYPEAYRTEFVRDIYYAANTFCSEDKPSPMAMAQERDANRNAMCKVIGLTMETRPDTINPKTLSTLRSYGCTRVQLGIQHLDNDVLHTVNRKCTLSKITRAISLLKDWGFKIDAHFMPNLPGSSPQLDREMIMDRLLGADAPYAKPSRIQEVSTWITYPLQHPELQVDQWKVYPCATTPFTEIEKWFKEGTYVPYGESELTPILLDMKANIFPWIRLNRIVRDIPTDYIIASGDHPNLRQDLHRQLRKRGQRCRCIRCREVKLQKMDTSSAQYIVREYPGSDGTEMFISYEHSDPMKETLYGFLRLRIPSEETPSPHPDFNDHVWIRELHVYGKLQKTTHTPSISSPHENPYEHVTQHQGIGKTLLLIAEKVAWKYYKSQLIVIAGEGTKNYYAKHGYKETHFGYMHKHI